MGQRAFLTTVLPAGSVFQTSDERLKLLCRLFGTLVPWHIHSALSCPAH